MPARFKVGDRVAYYEWPTDCGTVTEVVDDGPTGPEYRINWDHHRPSELLTEVILVPCSIRTR
jgi:hypothetical protein